MVTNKNPRQYEVSLWTLQDSFITVLKGYNTDNFGTIEEPSMELKDDSEDTFSFKLPMYIREEGEFKENPNWYNVTNGNLIINLRKIKVVFYKGTDRQAIFEFVITKVEESHEGFEKYCSVDCEGLAFNELGKTGYNIELSQDLYELECEEGIAATETCQVQHDEEGAYIELSNRSAEQIKDLVLDDDITKSSDAMDDEYNHKIYISSDNELPDEIEISYNYAPLNTIQYWIEKVLPADYNWDYRINMDWTDYYEDERQSDRLYEAAYIENWELNENNILIATSAAEAKEKFRIVEESGSNRYNLTQTIAETFGVFVRYIYEYDDNLYITHRTVEFYNSSLKEQEDALDFTYYYDTEDLSREMDSADQISKMYVLTGSGDDMLTSSITEVEANKSLENYLFNFEYLHDTGAIDDEQYAYIDEYEATMHYYNKQLQELESRISVYEEALVEFEASRDNAHVAAAAAEEAMEGEQAYVRHLLNSDKTDYDKNPETLSMTGGNPAYSVIIDDTEIDSDLQKHCAIRSYGVLPNSIIAFLTLNDANNFFKYMYGEDSALVEIQKNDKYYAVKKETGDFIEYNGKSDFDTEAEAIVAAKNWVLTEKIVNPTSGTIGYLPSWQYLVDINPETGFAEGLKQIQCDDNQTGLFLTYDYSLDLYHKTLAEQWQQEAAKERDLYDKYSKIVDKIDGPRDENDEWTSDDHGLLQECRDKQQEILKKKQELILDLENYLGPALREGTWQPDDDYARYGDRRSADYLLMGNSSFAPKEDNKTSIGWDKNLFDYEETNYDEEGFDQQKVYYPCIRLTNDIIQAISEKVQDEESNITMLDIGYVWDDTVIPGINPLIIATGNNPIPLEYPQIFRIGSESQIAFLKSKTDESEPVFPVLMLTNAASYCSTFDLSKQTGASQTEILQRLNGSIGILSTEEKEIDDHIEISYMVEPLVNSDSLIWISDDTLDTYDIVYPRIKIPYRNFVNNALECSLYVNDNLLLANYDWNIRGRYDINDNITSTDLDFWIGEDSNIDSAIYSYYVTISPESLIRKGIDINENFGEYHFSYKLSNTGLAIYLDAIEVMKENSVPKVTYNISPVILKTSFMEEAYNTIHRIIHINDPELKFKEVNGYISGLTLDLDHPWEDEVEVQNYTSKFEDLFSSIVASTASVKKNIVGISAASQAFVNTGEIDETILQKTLENSNVILKMNNDNFIIDDTGIKAYSDNGIVHYSNRGIFTADEKNSDGSWKWNTSILPSGISANAITTGQLDTNLIRIYSGDDLRFQMNSDGLFAYKSWFSTDLNSVKKEDLPEIEDEITRRDGLDPAQYVVMNSDGLFLHAKKGAYIYDSDTQTSTKVEYDIDRVEISWDGLILRNNYNQKTFYADPDTGNLNITGNLRIETTNNTIAELTDSKLRFGDYELVKTEKNNSECLSFVYYFSEGGD